MNVNNGLIAACLESTTTRDDWRGELLESSRLIINAYPVFSVYVDREVLRTQAPSVYNFLSHRVIDITTLGIIQWGLSPLESVAKSHAGHRGTHRAMADNEAAIAKLRWYLGWLRDRLTQSDYNNAFCHYSVDID